MISRKEVEKRLLLLPLFESCKKEALESGVEKGCAFIETRLKSSADENDPEVLAAAEAAARFFLFCGNLQEDLNFKAGDVSFASSQTERFKSEKELFDFALLSASSVLRDGEFFFETTG